MEEYEMTEAQKKLRDGFRKLAKDNNLEIKTFKIDEKKFRKHSRDVAKFCKTLQDAHEAAKNSTQRYGDDDLKFLSALCDAVDYSTA